MAHSVRIVIAMVIAGSALGAAPVFGQGQPGLPDLPDTELTLSWQDFKQLVEGMRPKPTPAPAPPREAFLRSAEYSGRLERGVLTLDAVLRLEVLKEGWIRLPLWSQGSVLSFSGGGAVLNRDGGRLEVLARGPASYQLRARLAFEASDHPGENRLALTLPDAPLNLLDVTAGAGLRDLEVETGLAYRAQPSRVYAALVGGSATLKYTLPYRPSADDTGEELQLEPRVLLTAYQFLNLGDGVIGGVLVHDYRVRVAEVSHFDIALPEGIEVFDATAPALESWKVLQRDGGRVLRVRLAAPADGDVRVLITFDGGYDAEAGLVRIPRFEPLEVERESGFVAVAADGAEVDLAVTGKLLPADVGEIPDQLRAFGGNLVSALKYSGAPDDGTVTIIEHEDAAVLTAIIERLTASTVRLADGVEATWLSLAVKNNRKQFLKLSLPGDEVEIWSLMVDGQPTRPKRSEGRLLVPLPTAGSEVVSQLSLVLLRRGDEIRSLRSIEPFLPGFDVPVSFTLWTLYLPADYRYRPVGDGFRVHRVTAPLTGRLDLRPQQAIVALDEAVDSYAPSRSYKEAELEQKKQAAEIQQQLVARQGASRRGSLPVRIDLPGGVQSLPQVQVSRILMVEQAETVLPIRVYPGWLRGALRGTQILLILAAGLLLGLLLAKRLPSSRRVWVGVVALAALLPIGGIGPTLALTWLVLIGLATALVAAIHRRLTRGRSEEVVVVSGPESDPDPD